MWPAPDADVVEKKCAVNNVNIVEDGDESGVLGYLPRVLVTGATVRIGADPCELAATRVPLEDHATDVGAEAAILNPVQDDLGHRNLGIERLVARFPIHRPGQAV